MTDSKCTENNGHGVIDIDGTAALSKLSVDDSKREKLAADMRAVVEFADALEKMNFEKLDAKEHIVSFSNVFREDIPEQKYSRAQLLANAQTKTEEYIYVPKVVE